VGIWTRISIIPIDLHIIRCVKAAQRSLMRIRKAARKMLDSRCSFVLASILF
jgi:hypothetical protein